MTVTKASKPGLECGPSPVRVALPAPITPERYGRVQIALHWGVGLLVIEQYAASGAILPTHAFRTLGSRPDPFDMTPHSIHTRVGLLIFALVAFRLLLRMMQGAPAWSPPLSAWRRRPSSSVHFGLYAVLLAQAATGAVSTYLWWQMSLAHVALFWALVVLLTLHLIGAAISLRTRPRETLFRIAGFRSPRQFLAQRNSSQTERS